MGLNETYGHARSQILMMIHLPSVSKAYAMIMADESQRVTSSMRTGGDMIEVTSLYAGRGNYSRNNRFEGDKNYSSVNTGIDNYNTKKKVHWNLFCDHCKIYGHTKKNCFKLVGYHEDWKFKKGGQGAKPNYNQSRGMNSARGKGIANNVQVEKGDDESRNDVFGAVNTESKHEQGAYDFHSIRTNLQAFAARPDYTSSQYKKIMKLLNEEEDARVVDMANMTDWRYKWHGLAQPAVTEVHDLNPVVPDDGHQQPDHDTTIEEVEGYVPLMVQAIDSGVPHVVPYRTSGRSSHPPAWMRGYVTNATDSVAHPHSLANYMTYSNLSHSYQAFLSEMSAQIEPRTYEEAVKDLRWVEAMK
ncbi:hypothetical protein KY284_023002 [Solanum tuberosum]|nr:hypothetical protein KY284_023002 [Solanum tuberosum]